MKREFKTRKSQETYERVLARTIDLFAREGFAQTSMRQVAAENAMGLGSLYYYFRSKEEVVLAYYLQLNRSLAEELDGMLAADSALPASFAAYLRRKLARLAPHRSFLHVVAREAVDPHSPLSPLSAETAGTRDASVGVFTRMALAAGFPAERAARLGPALWALHLGLLLYWLHDRSAGQAATDKAIDGAAAGLMWLQMAGDNPLVRAVEARIAESLAAVVAGGEQ